MKYVHVDTFEAQRSKHPGSACGDVISCYRDEISTIIILSDGIGSGVRANIYANYCTSRILGLISEGCSIHKTFRIMVNSMNRNWGTNHPFAVFSIARILLNGETTVLGYEVPDPLFVAKRYACILNNKVSSEGNARIRESHTILKPGDGLLMFSDGISQAGLGNGWPLGWQSEGIAHHLTNCLGSEALHNESLATHVLTKALSIWGNQPGDDCSLVYAKCRNGIIVNLLTGPPQNQEHDKAFIDHFLSNAGFKIVCGGSTAKLLSRESGKKLSIHENEISHIVPASYRIDGIDLVTEGMVTLNQVCNILDEKIPDNTDQSPVYELCRLLNLADRINILCGSAVNTEESHLIFRQQGLSPRQDIIHVLKRKLKAKGKLVVVKNEFLNEID